jgi:hypothetical protein
LAPKERPGVVRVVHATIEITETSNIEREVHMDLRQADKALVLEVFVVLKEMRIGRVRLENVLQVAAHGPRVATSQGCKTIEGRLVKDVNMISNLCKLAEAIVGGENCQIESILANSNCHRWFF